MKIMISPYSKPLRNGNQNAKNYPYWGEVVRQLKEKGDYIVQVGTKGEAPIWGTDEQMQDMSFRELEKYVNNFDCWISVDNFFHHMAAGQDKMGVVIFSVSDPDIFGHPLNFNLLKDRKYLRGDQFGIWETCPYNADAFIEPGEVVKTVDQYFRSKNGMA